MVMLLLGCVAVPDDSTWAACDAPGRVAGVVEMFDQPVSGARVTVWTGSTSYEVLADGDGMFWTTGLGELRLQPQDGGGSCQGPEKGVELEACQELSIVLEIDPDSCVDG